MIINEEQVVYEKVEKGNGIRVTKSTTKGKVYFDVRKLYTKDGELLPTRKGIMLSTDQWKEMITVLQEAMNEETTDSIGE